MIYIILYCSATITSVLPSSVPTRFDMNKWDMEESLAHIVFKNDKTKDLYFFPKGQCIVHMGRE